MSSLPPSDARATAPVPPPVLLTPYFVAGATLAVLLVIAAFWAVYRFHYAVFILLAAMMLRVAIRPAVDMLRARGVRANLSVLVVFAGLGALVAGLAVLLFPLMAEQLLGIAGKLPQYYLDLRALTLQSANPLLNQLGAALPQDWLALLPKWDLATAGQLVGYGPVAPAAEFFSQLGYDVFLFVATCMLTAYWTLDADRLTRALLMRVPQDKRAAWRDLITELESKVGDYFRGQLLLCGVIFALSTAAFLWIGLPYALVLGLIAGVFEALPMIGPLLGMLPALLIALATMPSQAIWVIIAATVIQQLENNLLVPRVMGKTVGINPIISILALAAFTSLFGLAGALFAIPVAAVLQLLITRAVDSATDADGRGAQQAVASPARGAQGMLRMGARELADDVRKQARTDAQASQEEPGANAPGTVEAIEDQIETMARDLEAWLAETPDGTTAFTGARP